MKFLENDGTPSLICPTLSKEFWQGPFETAGRDAVRLDKLGVSKQSVVMAEVGVEAGA